MRRRGRRRGRVVLLQEGRGLGAEDARDDRGESHGGVHGGYGRGRRVQARRVLARARRPDREERRRGRSSGSKEGRGRRVLGGQAARDRGGARARELHGGGGASRSCAKRRRLESRHASFGRRAGRSDAATPRTIDAFGRLLFPRSIGYGLFFPLIAHPPRPRPPLQMDGDVDEIEDCMLDAQNDDLLGVDMSTAEDGSTTFKF